jgi:hypothetical protein
MLTGTRSSGATSHTARGQQRVILNAAFAAPMRARTRTPGKQPLMPPKGSSASTSQPQHLPLRQCVLGRELPAANSLLPPAGGVLRRVHSKSGVLPSASTRPQQLRFQSQCLNLIVSPRPVWAQRPSRNQLRHQCRGQRNVQRQTLSSGSPNLNPDHVQGGREWRPTQRINCHQRSLRCCPSARCIPRRFHILPSHQ